MNKRFLAAVAASGLRRPARRLRRQSTAAARRPTRAATSPSGGGVVRISGQNFTEAEIVADMYAGVLEKAGYTPR